MPLLLDTTRSEPAIDLRAVNCITVGLINNMPDKAVEATERQFVSLIREATSNVVVRLKLFAMPDVPRGEAARSELADRYRDVAELWDTHLDGLIVTGAEPRAANLKDEPYWASLAKIVDWARDNTASTIWSCLAAHAAVLHADGIERRTLAAKRFGVFDFETAAPHPIMKGTALRLRVPHSRHNDLPETALAACGYRILTRSDVAGVDTFVKLERSFFLFLQGHPEYEAGTLLREYRRDVGRFLGGQREHYPGLPQGYFNDTAAAIANAFRERALDDRRSDLIAGFPMSALEAGLETKWRRSAVAIYENWFEYLKGRKADRSTLTVPTRRSWRDWPAGRVRPAADHSTP